MNAAVAIPTRTLKKPNNPSVPSNGIRRLHLNWVVGATPFCNLAQPQSATLRLISAILIQAGDIAQQLGPSMLVRVPGLGVSCQNILQFLTLGLWKPVRSAQLHWTSTGAYFRLKGMTQFLTRSHRMGGIQEVSEGSNMRVRGRAAVGSKASGD